MAFFAVFFGAAFIAVVAGGIIIFSEMMEELKK